VHGTRCDDSPTQGAPPLTGAGLLQVLVRLWEPLTHLVLQSVHALHADQTPFTTQTQHTHSLYAWHSCGKCQNEILWKPKQWACLLSSLHVPPVAFALYFVYYSYQSTHQSINQSTNQRSNQSYSAAISYRTTLIMPLGLGVCIAGLKPLRIILSAL